jgi:predicted RNase H-like HicB family nuclease
MMGEWFGGASTRKLAFGIWRELVKDFTVVVERCHETGLYVGYVPGFPGAHSQGETLDELHENVREVIAMLLEDGEPALEAEFVGTRSVQVG